MFRPRHLVPAFCLALALVVPTAAAARHGGGAKRGGGEARASIVGGKVASIETLPWLAYIEWNAGHGEVFSCSGSVIAPRLVLTAGHCVVDIETGQLNHPRSYRVATGVTNLDEVHKKDISTVARAVVYPHFDPRTLRGDAGILVLAAPVAAPALPLAEGVDTELLQRGKRMLIAGWGLARSNAANPPPSLQAAETVVHDASYCREKTGRYDPFFSAASQLCAIAPPHFSIGTCHGDSGGPALANRADGSPVEIGITSAGDPRCRTTLPDIFTRVDRISAWAQRWIAASEGHGAPPAVRPPKAEPPLMSFGQARDFVGRALGEDFGARFRHGRGKRIACERIEREKVKCGVAWFHGPNDYFGTVTVYFAFHRNTVTWNARYKIRWVDDRCWFHSGHRQTCRVHVRRR